MKLRPDSGPAKRTSVRRAYKRSVAALSRVHALPLRDSQIGCLLSETVSHRQQSTGALLANLLKLSKLSQIASRKNRRSFHGFGRQNHQLIAHTKGPREQKFICAAQCIRRCAVRLRDRPQGFARQYFVSDRSRWFFCGSGWRVCDCFAFRRLNGFRLRCDCCRPASRRASKSVAGGGCIPPGYTRNTVPRVTCSFAR